MNQLRRQLYLGMGGVHRFGKTATVVFSILIFSLSFSIKSLVAVDLSPTIYTEAQPAGGMAYEYHREAISIVESRRILFPSMYDSTRTELLIHPPGYPIYLAAIYSLVQDSYFTVQLLQNCLNSISPIVIFLIVGNLLTWRVGIVSGVLAAISHHFSYYSNFILPDSLCALPILLAVYFLVLTKQRGFRIYWMYAIAGVLIGLSVWLRANTLLLGVFIALFLPLILRRGQFTFRHTWMIATASVLVVMPITIRNYLIFGEFVPVSCNTGIVLWEGIADAGGERFGAVSSDGEVAEQESLLYDNKEYARGWAWPDGIKRDRDRIKRSLKVITDNPLWFARVMIWRMGEMFKYSAQAPLVFRSTDTRLIEESLLAQAEVAGSKREDSDELAMLAQRERSRRLNLMYGESISWARPFARLLQRAAKETALVFIILGASTVFILSHKRFLFLCIVPAYYLLVQSVMHLEFRYVLPMHYFIFVFAAVIWVLAGSLIVNLTKRLFLLIKR